MSVTLPPELWRIIFRFATHPPYSFRVSIHSQITSWNWENKPNDFAAYRDVHDTKISLVLVCREWFELGVEFLYEDVRPFSKSALQKFGEMVKIKGRSEEDQDQWGRRSYGALVKQLQTSSARYGSLMPHGEDFLDIICDILPYIPNVESICPWPSEVQARS